MNEALTEQGQQEQPTNLLAVVDRAARDPNIDVDKMERLLALAERVKARDAEVAFNQAMADVQKVMPRIARDAENPSTKSLYTKLESLNEVAVPIYTKHGFSLSFGTADCPIAGQMRITCTVMHALGHSKVYQIDLPADTTGAKGLQNKTGVHGAGSSLSYGRRYLTLLIFNISCGGMDDDGNSAGGSLPQQGPSKVEKAKDELRAELWAVLEPVRGQERNWKAANQWLWDEMVIEPTESAPAFTPERFRQVIDKAAEKLVQREGR